MFERGPREGKIALEPGCRETELIEVAGKVVITDTESQPISGISQFRIAFTRLYVFLFAAPLGDFGYVADDRRNFDHAVIANPFDLFETPDEILRLAKRTIIFVGDENDEEIGFFSEKPGV